MHNSYYSYNLCHKQPNFSKGDVANRAAIFNTYNLAAFWFQLIVFHTS